MHVLTTAPTLPQVTVALNGEHFLSARPPAIYRYYQQSVLSIFPTGGPVGGGTLVTVRGYGLVNEPLCWRACMPLTATDCVPH